MTWLGIKLLFFISWPLLLQSSIAASKYQYQCYKAYAQIEESERVLKQRLEKVASPEVPDLHQQNLVTITMPDQLPQKIVPKTELSPGVTDPLLERVRELNLVDDFKPLSDLKLKPLTAQQLEQVKNDAIKYANGRTVRVRGKHADIIHEKYYLRYMLDHAYEHSSDLIVLKGKVAPRWKINSGNQAVDEAFNYTEEYLPRIIRKTPTESKGSMLPTPYEVVVPNDKRFDEFYYWDTYFGVQGLLETKRYDLAQKQVENFLYLLRQHGLIPNGNRDYYLGRSQPPFISSLVHDVYYALKKEHAGNPALEQKLKHWLKERAFPLLEKDLNLFWMNPKGRFDHATGLHHHWDDLNFKRPERSAHDIEVIRYEGDHMGLGIEPRDARATAESGLDFSAELDQRGSKVANVLLNSMLYQYMQHMSDFAREIGHSKRVVQKYQSMAQSKKRAMDKYLWNESEGVYRNYNLEKKAQVPVVSASTFVPLYVGAASESQAQRVMQRTLQGHSQSAILETEFGVRASNAKTHHQWDDDNLWAPYQYMAWEGLNRYGYQQDAQRLAQKYVNVVSKVHAQEGVFMERYNARTGTRPSEDGDKYATQEGFLWTNSTFVVAIRRYLGIPLLPR